MEKRGAKGLFTCPHCHYNHRVFRITCPKCGRLLVRDFSENIDQLQTSRRTEVYTGRWILRAIGIVTMIWILILLLFYFY